MQGGYRKLTIHNHRMFAKDLKRPVYAVVRCIHSAFRRDLIDADEKNSACFSYMLFDLLEDHWSVCLTGSKEPW